MEDENNQTLKNQEDVNPTSQLDQIVTEEGKEKLPETNGTGSNRPIHTSGTLIIKDDDAETEEADDIDDSGKDDDIK